MTDCIFCKIASGDVSAHVLWEDADVVVFLDIAPVREGHCHVIPRAHYETFEVMPPDLAARMVTIGQTLAKRLKEVYGVPRVAFLFTGGGVPHVHAHVIPMHEKTDVRSARYLINPVNPEWSSEHLRVTPEVLDEVRRKLGFEV